MNELRRPCWPLFLLPTPSTTFPSPSSSESGDQLSHVKGTFGNHFVRVSSPRNKCSRRSMSMFSRAAKEGVSLIPLGHIFNTLWLMGPSSTSFLLCFKPPTPTRFFSPEKCERELWETGGGCQAGRREGGVSKNRTQPPLEYYQPRQDAMRINEASPGAEMDYMTSGSPLTKSWNSHSPWDQMRALRIPGCVSCHLETSLTSVFLKGEGWPLSDCWVSLKTQRNNCAAKWHHEKIWASNVKTHKLGKWKKKVPD